MRMLKHGGRESKKVNKKEFILSLGAAHKFFNDLGIAEPLVGPSSLPANGEFNRIALDTELPYTDVFFAGLRIGQYNFKLTDFSYLQFSYTNPDDVRYAFYPSPFSSEGLGHLAHIDKHLKTSDDADFETFMALATSIKVNYRRPAVRYEYNFEQYEAGVHPVSHLHIGTYGDDRWPLQPCLTPLAFSLLIGKLYFRTHWEVVTEGEKESRKNEFDALLEKERAKCSVTPAEKFELESRSFYFT